MSHERSCLSKKSYFSESTAKSIASRIFEERHVPLRVYHCEYCLCFHLTKLTNSNRVTYITFCRSKKLYDYKIFASYSTSLRILKEEARERWKKDSRVKNIKSSWVTVFNMEKL